MIRRIALLGFLLVALAFAAPAQDQTNRAASISASNQVSVVKTNRPAGPTNDTSASGDAAPEIQARSFLGQRAPKLEVEKWFTPAPSMQGKFVLVDFWATWCVSCHKSIPGLNEFHRKYKDRLVIVGLTDETEEQVRKTTLPPMEYFTASDPDEHLMSALEIQGLPYSILIDPAGIVRFQGNPLDLDDKQLQRLLDQYSK